MESDEYAQSYYPDEANISKKIDSLHPVVKKKALEHKNKCKTLGIDLLIYCGARTMDEQAALYAQGRTKPGKIVTNAPPGSSWHNFFLAYDVVEVKNNICLWENPNWDIIGQLGKQEGMLWGGDWTRMKDRPHFEYHPGLTIKDAQNRFSQGLDLLQQEAEVETIVPIPDLRLIINNNPQVLSIIETIKNLIKNIFRL